MIVIKDPHFEAELEGIVRFIATDSKTRASSFVSRLFERIENLKNQPFKFRKSLYHANQNIRDLIFMGYTIPYFVDEANGKIVVLDIFKWIDKKHIDF